MIPGICPDCGSARPLPDYLADAEARAALAAALECPAPLARLIVPYLALHAPPGRRVQMGKLTRVIATLAALLQAQQATHKRDTITVPLGIWQTALQAVLDQHAAGTVRVPLDGHGYLVSIAVAQALAARHCAVAQSAPRHQSHRPFADAAQPTDATPAATAADRAAALAAYRSTQRLMEHASGAALMGLRPQLSAQAARLRAMGIQLPDAPPTPDDSEARDDHPDDR